MYLFVLLTEAPSEPGGREPPSNVQVVAADSGAETTPPQEGAHVSRGTRPAHVLRQVSDFTKTDHVIHIDVAI